ncbi:ribonuclease H-like domain-containing protein [Tanacetum coccineum]
MRTNTLSTLGEGYLYLDFGSTFIKPYGLSSNLVVSSPLHLHLNDYATLTVVPVKLKGTENYQVWSCAMLLPLEGKNKIGFIDGTCKRSNTDEVLARDRVNEVESHRVVASSSSSGTPFPSVSVILVINSKVRPNGGSALVCENCGFNGHTIDRCFKIMGYPADFEKKE